MGGRRRHRWRIESILIIGSLSSLSPINDRRKISVVNVRIYYTETSLDFIDETRKEMAG